MTLMKASDIHRRSVSGCDGAGSLIPVDIALEKGLLLAGSSRLPAEDLPLRAAHGRALAEDVRSPSPLPRFDHAAMDGYALRCGDLGGAGPWRLPLAGRIAAGDDGRTDAPTGAALRIMTGARIPPGVDTVVMQEAVAVENSAVILAARPTSGQNIRRCGEDIAAGRVIAHAGRDIDARVLGVLASAGLPTVRVRQKLRVALFSTGSELAEPGAALNPGQIYGSNRYMLTGQLDRRWIELIDFGNVPDDPKGLEEALEEARTSADAVISTGGVSAGDTDYMPGVVSRLGGELHAMRLAMKPGKPLVIGAIGQALYLGLPGNPVAAFTTMAVLGMPILERRAGFAPRSGQAGSAVAGFSMKRRSGRREYVTARSEGRDALGRLIVKISDRVNSGRVAQLAQADGFVILEAGTESVREGGLVGWLPFDHG